ncbi:MAG: trimethylamine--corrinoid protein Co-methyltransferase [Verrucomicrobiales bacterium]|jgi:trimethylamine--corrinoid protein Co-methyltransferase
MQQVPFRSVRRHFEATRVVSDDELESIHDASLIVLRDIGIDVLDEDARRLYVDAGAVADDDRVRFDPAMVTELIKTCPSEFTLHAPNPDHNVRIGGDNVVFTAVASPPNVSGNGEGRRTGNRSDFQNLVRLSQHFNAIHMHAGYPVEPSDIHASVRHLHATHDLLTLSDKAINVYSLGRQRNRDCLEMVRIARQVSDEQLDQEPSVHTVINSSSPLRLDIPMLQGIMEYSARNQVVIMTPFTLAGAMAPVTVVGAVTQQNAEALAGMALTQIVRAGSPVVYGGFTSNVDMKSGSPAFGTPEFMTSAMLGGQLARRYAVPYRSSNVNASNSVDAQAGYESVFSLWGAIMGGANIVFHGAGWLEGGLNASFEKMVLDVDLLSMMQTFLQPVVVDDSTLALEAMADVGPGGHFFGTQHTQDRYKTAFYSPMVSDWRNFEAWEEAGSPTAVDKTTELVPRFLSECVPPHIDDSVRAELGEFVARRVEEGGVPTDY